MARPPDAHNPDAHAAAYIITDLLAIVKRLPVTADGVPIAPGMMVWVPIYVDEANGDTIEDSECLVTGVTNYRACDAIGDDPEAQCSFKHAGLDCHQLCDGEVDSGRGYSTRAAAEAARGKG